MPLLVPGQLVPVNYGEFASANGAETFGASVMGFTKNDYYHALYKPADQLDFSELVCGAHACEFHSPLPRTASPSPINDQHLARMEMRC